MDGDDYRGEAMDWKHLLAYITGTVDQELLLRNEYLVTENRILRRQLKGRIRLRVVLQICTLPLCVPCC